MKMLLVGSGGREHALAWKLTQSARLERLWIAPGNAGTFQVAENLPIQAEDIASLVSFAHQEKIDLVLVGPEGPLAGGLVDALQGVGVPAFGPTRAAARIETSKAFAKDFMERHGIPTARWAAFRSIGPALQYLDAVGWRVVIKASGLAAGKGVFVPQGREEAEAALRLLLVERAFGPAGEQVLIEERLEGPEVSLLAFTDGKTVRVMPPAQDHKRLLDGDRGPNTGGMGAYAPAPVCPPALVEQLVHTVLQPAVDGLRAEGCPFLGVLYAGLMLTAAGPRVLEFNARFGDPETQVLLPLLETDLLEVITTCLDRRLDSLEVRWKPGAAACVVLAAEGYPGSSPRGRTVTGLEQPPSDSVFFHAGTCLEAGRVTACGGRVLNAVGWGTELPQALERAYAAAAQARFEGLQYRKDIGAQALERPAAGADPAAPAEAGGGAYGAAGVNLAASRQVVDEMRAAVASTYGPQVLAGLGAFGGQFDAGQLLEMRTPVLVASTDGVGTKVILAAQADRLENLGQDIVNHCVNDILVQGARPLFFLDYLASAHLEPGKMARIVAGMAAACREAGCALLGGETAEMPGVYAPGHFDVVGTIVGVVEREARLPRPDLAPGDLLIGLRSSGPHTNGFSLIRKVFAGLSLETSFPELGSSLADALLAPHRSYLYLLQKFLFDGSGTAPRRGAPGIKALIHITGGGFDENVPRVLPPGLSAILRRGSWPIPPLFDRIAREGQVPAGEMARVFNLGLGMLAVVSPQDCSSFQAALGEESWVVGELGAGNRSVEWA